MIITQCVILTRVSDKLMFIHKNKVFDCYFSLNLAETKTLKVIIASLCILVLIFSSSSSQSSCLKADSSFIWKTTTHNRFVVFYLPVSFSGALAREARLRSTMGK